MVHTLWCMPTVQMEEWFSRNVLPYGRTLEQTGSLYLLGAGDGSSHGFRMHLQHTGAEASPSLTDTYLQVQKYWVRIKLPI